MQGQVLAGRTILVTGASSGLGQAFAKLFARNGAAVALAARRMDRLERIVDDIRGAGGRCVPIAMDVGDPASIEAGFAAAEAALGPIDGMVANAGVNAAGMVIDITPDQIDEVLSVNVKGVMLSVQAAGRRMIANGSAAQERARIVIISSMTANTVGPGIALYSASKAAIQHFGKLAAREWTRQGISLNIVNPGYIATELNDEWFESPAGKGQIARWPRKRLMQESDLDPIMLYLLSDAARGVTGSVFTIDDGQSLKS
ncbi:SDR family NAD(P)-dependent oxidoreductase [Novosphingobium bradum]|uniref:SDR family NAD(P)-dependent oxidoreductase n=1 Tax=Novosphingobium bradum TaxID=1737444 RepID=A0ABV7IV27_9SPHN